MKNNLIPVIIIMVIAGIHCKKKPLENVPPADKKWIVTTVAGEGSPSFVNGPALSATFHFPEDVAVTPDGIIYVTDVLNFCIRRIANGGVSNFAGGSGAGITDGIGSAAKFIFPYSVALDAYGNLYTSDENDPRIRKISPVREVSVYAGAEVSGFADGNADTARFSPGCSLIADAEGNVYVSDGRNNRIRKITLSRQVSTVAGTGVAGFSDGNGASAQFNTPGGIAIDPQGNLYVVDRGNFRVRKITPEGTVSTVAGSGSQGFTDGNPSEAQFSQDMRDIVIDEQENLYLSDGERIRKITRQGFVSTIAGSIAGYKDGEGSQAKFSYPNGLGIDVDGKIYVADLNNNRIRKISFEK